MTPVKICGITTVHDARLSVELGANAIGVNLWPRSKRCISTDRAREINDAVGNQARVVGVFVDPTVDQLTEFREQTGIPWLQVHSKERPPVALSAFLPHAYAAVAVHDEFSLGVALESPGEELLLDRYDPQVVGGTGQTCDWDLAAKVASRRKVWLAGGLHAENVRAAIARVQPFGIDIASGVESRPGHKDPVRLQALFLALQVRDD